MSNPIDDVDYLEEETPFTIELLDGPFAGRVIKLTGRAKPYRPIKFGGKQRINETYNPGNPVATLQVLGPTENPTTINGTWKDIFLGVGAARQLQDTFDDLRRAGVLLRITWGVGLSDASFAPSIGGALPQPALSAVGVPIVREGIIEETEFTLDRFQDVQFDITFKWRGRAEQVAPPTTATPIVNPREGFQQLADDVQEAADAMDAFRNNPFVRVYGLADELEGDLDDVSSGLAVVNRGLNNLTGAVTALSDLPFNVAQTVIGLCARALENLQNLNDLITIDIPQQFLEVQDDAIALLALQRQLFATLGKSESAREQAAVMQATLEGRLLPETIGEEMPPAGTDLRDLALRYYGDPDLWWLIARFNRMSSSTVPSLPTGPSDEPVRPIRIPRRIEGALGDLRAQC